MARIITIKLEIPADDDARVEDVKTRVRAAVHAIGRTGAEAEEGQTTILDRTVFFDAATIKYWVTPGERKKIAKVTP